MKGMGENLTVGHGAKLQKTDVLFEQGSFVPTGRMLDYAIADRNGFLESFQKQVLGYTRDGILIYKKWQTALLSLYHRGGYICDPDNNL